MYRFLTITMGIFMALAATWSHAGVVKGKDFNTKGQFTKDDQKDALRNGAMHSHTLALKAGTAYTIDMVSADFDCYLRLLDPKGKQLDEDDDGGGGLNSKIVFNCTMDGDYKIITTTFGAGAYGNYTLTVKTSGAVQKAATGHTQMVGKAAPDFNADFALNGNAKKLADLKGKVVLLCFLDLRSSSCAAFQPKLNDWHKAHNKDGLVIVGVTYYTSEIGQKLAFDTETGLIKTVKEADRKSDQALLKAYAEHHKIEHPMLVLSKADALAAYETYIVNGVPQAVIIDRKGVVRLIDINGEKGAANLEGELKKVLTGNEPSVEKKT